MIVVGEQVTRRCHDFYLVKLPLLFETSMHAASYACCITSYLSATNCCEMYDSLALTPSTTFEHLDTAVAFDLV